MDGNSEQENTVFGEWITPETLAKEIKENNLPVNYGQIIDGHRVILLGEEHFNLDTERHLVKYARDLKEAGITHFAFEVSARHHQQVFDQLNNKEEVEEEVLKKVFGEFGWDTEANLAKTLVAQGIKIVPISEDIDEDLEEPELPKFKSDVEEFGREMKKYHEEIEKREQIILDSTETRELAITDNIMAIIADPFNKVAVNIGADHVSKHKLLDGRASTTRRRLEENSVDVISAVIVGGVGLGVVAGYSDEEKVFLEGAQHAGLAEKEFMLDMRAYAGLNPPKTPYGAGNCEYLIHVPQDLAYTKFVSKILKPAD